MQSYAKSQAEQLPDGAPHRFAFADRQFVLDDRPMRIYSGEMHPSRIPREHWLHRIRMAKAMGLNTISIYLMWNYLESEPGIFDLSSGNRDFTAFIRLCQQEQMWVYLRPGPYICGEWTMGGLPAYLLRDPNVSLRDRHDAGYMAGVQRYIDAVAPRIAPLMVARGGPILMLQVENEYSMFASDVGYLEAIRNLWKAHGIDGPWTVSDGWPDLQRRRAYLPGAALGLDGATPPVLALGHTFAHEAPVWVGECYPGWITHWGERHFARRDCVSALRSIMSRGYSFNLYVVHGGTNFGLTAGANADDDGSNFQPVITSYDYGAPINEQGDPTPAYFALRRMILAQAPSRSMPVPAPTPKACFADALARPHASLWDNLPATPAKVTRPVANEIVLGQDQGLVLYRKRTARATQLHVDGVRDYATIHVDGQEIGHVSRMRHPKLHTRPDHALPASAERQDMLLEILVDSFGHVNFGPPLGDRKGLVGNVHLDGVCIEDWEVYGLALDDQLPASLKPLQAPTLRTGLFFLGELQINAKGDTYLDMRAWNKGYVWVNGHLLGRYWHVGPQQSLYCPGEWLHRGVNQVVVLDLHQTLPTTIHCTDRLLPTFA